MERLLRDVRKLVNSELRGRVDARTREFCSLGRKGSDCLFKELCFCILTANYNAERTIRIQDKIGNGFITLPEKKLALELRRLGHRFPNTRAKYIVEARKHIPRVRKVLSTLKGDELREWIVGNVKGLGMKEASHFLRNIGFTDYAIIDFHIVDILVENNVIKKPKTLGKRAYLEIEGKLREMGGKLDLNLAELDLYLWYMETGKILK